MPRRKRRRAWGSIAEVQRGKKYVLRWPDPAKRCGRATETVRGTYRQACERLDVIHADMIARGGASRSWTVGRIYEECVRADYGRRVELGKLKPASLKLYERAWEKHARPRWAGVRIAGVRPAEVQEWLLSLPGGAAKMSLVVLQKAGDFAVRNELADRNVFKGGYLMPKGATARSHGVYDNAAADAALASVAGTPMEAPYILMAFGGCRTGESLGVRCAEVSPFERGGQTFALVPIVRRMDAKGSQPMPDHDLKTPESDRVTVVPPPYAGRLLGIARALSGEGREWLADRGDGLPMNKSIATYRWDKLLQADGSPDAIPLQNLRTSWRTMAAMEWRVSSDVLEMVMGHKLPGTTGKHYMRPSWEQIAERFADEFARKPLDLG